jgi:SAM-dependent methyltransferase
MNHQDNFYFKIEANKFFERNFLKVKKDIINVNNFKLRKSKNEILQIIKKNTSVKNKNVLEIGCFISDLLNILKKKYNCNVSGVEPSSYACKFAKKEFGLNIENKTFLNSKYVTSKKKYKDKFDIIICDDVLSWIDREIIMECILSINYILKYDGHIFFRDFSPPHNIAVKNHHHKSENIYNYKVAGGHKSFFLMTGQYRTIFSKKFITNKYQVNKSKSNITNIWTHDLIKKTKKSNYIIKDL